jgi:OOP family OmpA-OmpF porin
VKDYLESHGVAGRHPRRAEGLGEANPIADNRTAKGRAENRRVTVEFTATVMSH